MKNIMFGTTSYIYKGTRAENVRLLKGSVDVVQLLFLEKSYLYEDMKELQELYRVKGDSKLDYIIHMPLDLNFLEDIDLIKDSMSQISLLDPRYFVIHPENNNYFYSMIQNLSAEYPIVIENIDDISVFDNIRCKICFDVGHAILHGVDIIDFIKRYGDDIKVYHLHGVLGKVDHVSLKYLDEKLLIYLIDFAIEKGIIGIIEVFNENDFNDSINYIKEVFKKYGYSYYRWS
ncbi:MAG: hypothetical protein LDL13_04035 [Calditerrivibrio sp.]|nr:hypothetical protein [Calditerrivibrio sp.]MCA1932726.1 hypothetical protein [Calditerrivibrio sp.]